MKPPSLRPRLIVPLIVLLALITGVWTVAAQQIPVQPSVSADCPYVLKAGIPFAWLRVEPSSVAASAVTMLPGQTITLNNPPILAWDGVQWWLYVWPNFAPNVHGYYWVELGSIEIRCQPPTLTPTPTPTPLPPPPTQPSGAAPWQPGYTVRVRLNVPFVWFRSAPAPGNQPIYTVFPGWQLLIVQGPAQDSYGQWWWLMRDPRNGMTGWVEQNSTELVSGGQTPVPPPTEWQIGDIVRVRLSVPFSWVRQMPSSNSAWSYTARPGQQLIVQQGPVNDGVQNWYQVGVLGTGVSGWVEQGSLEFVGRPR